MLCSYIWPYTTASISLHVCSIISVFQCDVYGLVQKFYISSINTILYLLTTSHLVRNRLQGGESFSRSWLSLSWSRKFPHFYEAEVSLPPMFIWAYSEPVQYSLQSNIWFLELSILILSPYLYLGATTGLFVSEFLSKFFPASLIFLPMLQCFIPPGTVTLRIAMKICHLIRYCSDFLHSSDTAEKMAVQWDSSSAVHRLQESLWFSEEGSIVQYFLRVWGTHETSQAN
jgi:hypothetical protein